MNLTELTDNDLNRLVVEKIMNGCWHEDGFMPHKEHPHTLSTCESCGYTTGSMQAGRREKVTPNYCSDDSPRRLLNEVVAKVGASRTAWLLDERAPSRGTTVLLSSAKQIVIACLQATDTISGVETKGE